MPKPAQITSQGQMSWALSCGLANTINSVMLTGSLARHHLDHTPINTKRNYLICDEFFITFSENVMNSLLWVSSLKTRDVLSISSQAHNTVMFKQILHRQQTKNRHVSYGINRRKWKKIKKLFCSSANVKMFLLKCWRLKKYICSLKNIYISGPSKKKIGH